MIEGFSQLDAIRPAATLDLDIAGQRLDGSEVRADRFFLSVEPEARAALAVG